MEVDPISDSETTLSAPTISQVTPNTNSKVEENEGMAIASYIKD